MKTALPGQRSIQETRFSPGIFAPIFSSTDAVRFRPSLPQNTNTGSASGLLFPFQMGLQPGCQKGILQRDFWLAPVDPWFSSHAENNDALHAPGPVAQDHQPWPSTPEALHVCGVLRDHTSPGMCLPAQGTMADCCFLCSCLIFRASITRRYKSGEEGRQSGSTTGAQR